MFNIQTYINDINEVPTNWIAEYYLKIPYKLKGQSIKLRSIFNLQDTNPSMSIYYNASLKKYAYSCFSTGNHGSMIDLMKYKLGLEFADTCNVIIEDYKQWLANGNKAQSELDLEGFEWKVKNVVNRKWNRLDADYWTSFNIGSKILERFNVKPILSFTLYKQTLSGKEVDALDYVPQEYVYGYYKSNGELYKIYMPHSRNKFIILDSSYIQGEEQLEGNMGVVIMSSLKDIMAVYSLGVKVDMIAPNSENSILKEEYVKKLKKKYKQVVVLFDNDEAGKRSMDNYRKTFNVSACLVLGDKDISDLIKNKGVNEALCQLIPKLNYAIEKYKK